jgi:hypothetical protein
MKKRWIILIIIVLLIGIVPVGRLFETRYIKQHFVLDKTQNRLVLKTHWRLPFGITLPESLGNLFYMLIELPSSVTTCRSKGGAFVAESGACHLPYYDAGRPCITSSECTDICIPSKKTLEVTKQVPTNYTDKGNDYSVQPIFVCGSTCEGVCSKYDYSWNYSEKDYENPYYSIKDGQIYSTKHFIH